MPDVTMRGLYWLLLVIAAMAGSAGCSTRGVYEGIQQQESIKNPPPPGQPATRRPTYDEYETERRKTGAQ